MDEVQKREYDFFLRMAALAQMEAVDLAPYQDTNGAIKALFLQHIDDMENCKYYARGIAEGFVFVHRDNVPKVERRPVDESKIPPKYR